MQGPLRRADGTRVEPLQGSPASTQEVVLPLRSLTALAAALAAACCTVTAATAGASGACGPSGYAYAGIQPVQTGYGVSATITALATPIVESGHVAGWVGVGGPGQGPGGSSEWIQVGLNSLPGTGNRLYYEVMQPGSGMPTYGELDTNVAAGRPLQVAVLETAGSSGVWRIWIDGRPVTGPIALPGSHGTLAPMAMGESWDGGRPACNRYNYRFERVSVAGSPGGAWQPVRSGSVLQDAGYRVIRRAVASFDATTTNPLPPETRATTSARPTPAPAPAAAQTAAARAATRAPAAAARAVSANAPLRKGFVPTPSDEAVLALAAQPEPDDPDLGLGVTLFQIQ